MPVNVAIREVSGRYPDTHIVCDRCHRVLRRSYYFLVETLDGRRALTYPFHTITCAEQAISLNYGSEVAIIYRTFSDPVNPTQEESTE